MAIEKSKKEMNEREKNGNYDHMSPKQKKDALARSQKFQQEQVDAMNKIISPCKRY